MRSGFVVAAGLAVLGVSPAAHAQGPQRAPSSCNLPHATGVSDQQLVAGQRSRTYRLYVPSSYTGRTPVPLVLDLHGSGGNAAGQARNSGLEAVAAREGFAVASLQAEGSRWNVPVQEGRPDDVAYVDDVITHVAARVCTDLTRVYATGFSGGARMSSLLACRLNGRIAAIAPVSGLRWPGSCPGRAVPVLTFHGLADPQNTYAGGVAGRNGEWVESVPDALAGWAGHNRCALEVISEDPAGPLSTMRYTGCAAGADVRLVRIDGLGHVWTKTEVDTTEVMWQFFKNHRLGS